MSEMIRLRFCITDVELDSELDWDEVYSLPVPIEYRKADSNEVNLEWYVESESEVADFQLKIEALPFDGKFDREDVTAEDWNAYWRTHFSAQRIGENLHLIPEWEMGEVDVKESDMVLMIRPGLGFGTGDHFTTSFCLEAIERFHNGYTSFADIGTGSGILSVAAAKLGFTNIFAFDNDKLACECARDNLELNHVSKGVDLHCLDLREAPEFSAQFVCANIYDLFLIEFADRIVPRAQHMLVLTGIRAQMIDEVAKTYAGYGLQEIHRSVGEEWSGVVFSV